MSARCRSGPRRPIEDLNHLTGTPDNRRTMKGSFLFSLFTKAFECASLAGWLIYVHEGWDVP